jgi:hypothetical protein
METLGQHHCPVCKQLILDIWGTDCPYCRRNIPSVKKRSPNRIPNIIGFTFVGIIIFGFLYNFIFTGRSTDISIVHNSAYDGSVYEVETYLKINLKDPSSYESINWGKVIELEKDHTVPHRYVVRHKYRAKNSFGGYVINNQIFYLDDYGKVIDVKDNPE